MVERFKNLHLGLVEVSEADGRPLRGSECNRVVKQQNFTSRSFSLGCFLSGAFYF